MLVECISIILIILLMTFVFLRSGKREYAITTVPLLILPLMHVLSLLVSGPLNGVFSLDAHGITVAMDATALVFSCLFLGLFSHRISSKKARNVCLLICVSFVVVLTWVLIANTIGGMIVVK